MSNLFSKSLACIVVTCAIGVSVNCGAVPLSLHGTGEGLAQGASDPNWTVILPDSTLFGPAISATDPNGGWIAPTPPSTWISVVGRDSVPVGVYEYATTFTIASGLDPATAQISGNWWSDEPQLNNGIYLNGVRVSDFPGAVWFDPDPANAFFAITSGFVSGVNTLSFRVENTGGPGGMLIQDLTGSARSTGAPDGGATVALLGLGIIGLQGLRRRLSR
jgi:hypothetical protein